MKVATLKALVNQNSVPITPCIFFSKCFWVRQPAVVGKKQIFNFPFSLNRIHKVNKTGNKIPKKKYLIKMHTRVKNAHDTSIQLSFCLVDCSVMSILG